MDPLKNALTRPDGVATRLRSLRMQAGIAAKDLAAQAEWHSSKVSRIENGRQVPSPADVETWGRITSADPKEINELIEILDDAQADQHSWRLSMRRGQAEVQADYHELLVSAQMMRELALVAVPGLLQTPAYARRMFEEMRDLHQLPVDDVDEAVRVRRMRQELLYDTSKQFEFLLAEPVLRWLLVPVDVMRGQLDRLQSVIDVSNVRFGILPMGIVLKTIPQNSVAIFVGKETIAAVETFADEAFHRGKDAEAYMRALDRLWKDAVTGEDARAMILAAIRDLPS